MNRVDFINKLIFQVQFRIGNQLLYKDFTQLTQSIEQDSTLSREETVCLEELINVLLTETERYSSSTSGYLYYPLWSAGCLDCATILVNYLPDTFDSKNEISQKIHNFTQQFLLSPLLLEFFRTQTYKSFRNNVLENESELLWKVASNCFYLSDEGRRPRDNEEEFILYSIFLEGYELANAYFRKTMDASHFPDWFSRLSPLKIATLSDVVASNRQLRGNDSLLHYLDDTLDKQLVLLKTWLETDTAGFVEYWGVKKMESLLELVDDTHFFYALNKICLLKNNPQVKELLQFYAEDDEAHIREYVSRLLHNY